MKNFLKSIWENKGTAFAIVVFCGLVIAEALLPMQRANGATIIMIRSNTATGVVTTNTNTTVASTVPLTTNTLIEIQSNQLTGVVSTNSNTTVEAAVPYWPLGGGYVYGNTNGQLSFFGAQPTNCPLVAFGAVTTAGNSTMLSNIINALYALGIVHTN